MKTPYIRKRLTKITAQRAANMRRLIATFQQHSRMTFDQVMAHLEMSHSGTRKYLRELLDAEVIHPVERHLFKISGQAQINAFDKTLEAPRPDVVGRRRKDQALPQGVFLHIMGDDDYKHPKRTNVVPRRGELETYLFGPAPTAKEDPAP